MNLIKFNLRPLLATRQLRQILPNLELHIILCLIDASELALMAVLYSLYWVFWGGVQKKEVKKGKIVVSDVQVSTAACI